MPTRSFEWRKACSVGLFPGTGNVGNGNDNHLPIGTNSEGKRFRALIRWQHDWSGVEVLNSATLTLKGTSSNNHISKGGSNTVRVARLNSSFSDSGGSENNWRTDAGTVWPGVDSGWGATVTKTINPGNNTDHTIDVTNIVRQWYEGTHDNYGLMVDDNGGNLQAEFGSGRGSNVPTLVIDYETATKPTVEWLYPSAEWVPVQGADTPGAMTVGLHWDVTLGVTDTQLITHDYEVVRVSDSVVVASGSMLISLPVVPRLIIPADPGEAYDVKVTVEGNGGAGPNSSTRTFVMPAAEAVHVVSLGIEPESVGVSRTLAPDSRDTYHTAYVASTTADESGKVGDWTEEVPNGIYLPATSYWLLVRSRIVRADGSYIPLDPEGIDAYRVSWRSKA